MDFCVCCGEYVPEGAMVCKKCRIKYGLDKSHCKRKRDMVKYRISSTKEGVG